MMNLSKSGIVRSHAHLIARFLGVAVIILGVLSLGTGLLRLFFSGAQYQEEWLKSLKQSAGTIETELGLLRYGSILSISAGIFLIGLGRSLLKSSRRAWRISVFITGVLSLSFLLLRTNLQLPGGDLMPTVRSLLGISSFVILAVLIVARRYFNARPQWNLTITQVVALFAIAVATAYGILGSYALRDEFSMPDMKWHDAVYFTVVTYTTLGYGDIIPIGERAKWFTVSLVIFGISAFVTAGAALFEPFIQGKMMGVLSIMGRSENQKLRDHVIVCGYTNVGESVTDYLRENQKAFVVIEINPFLSDSASRRNKAVINADPTLEESLFAARIDTAESLIACLDDDAHNVMIVLVANDLKKQNKCRGDLRVIARAENQSAISKVESAGADYVLSPSTMAGKAMAELSTEKDEQNRERISGFWK